MSLIFVEALGFTDRVKWLMDDEAYRALQNEIAGRPGKGKVMPGCGGLRKLRFADSSKGKGKRVGVRVIYLYTPEASRIDFLDVYGKDEKDDLSAKEKKILAAFARAARDEAIEALRRSGGKS
jgi:mRNA-degrading endonuclease RelE of RelBE toxin-antitoxin system